MKEPMKIEAISDIMQAAHLAADEFGRITEKVLWWRGHSMKDWSLVPKLYRSPGLPKLEANLSRQFLQGARTRSDKCPKEGDIVAWLFFMQHYGLPTRLLDWTESPLIATFFAVDTLKRSGPAALWAINPFYLNQSQGFGSVLLGPAGDLASPLFKAALEQRSAQTERIMAIVADQVDSRMMAQYSTFTIHGTATPLEKLKESEKFVIRFEIPESAMGRLSEDLYLLGIRKANLFPDLDHLASELTNRAHKIVEIAHAHGKS